MNNHLVLNNKPLNYEILAGENEDNPSPEMFELARESDGDSSRVVILEKSGKKHSFGPLVVPPGEIFLLGDNRDTSDDSRYWGTVPLSQISGRAF